MNATNIIHFILFTIINVVFLEFFFFLNILIKVKKLKKQLKSSIMFISDDLKTDEEKSKIALDSGIKILKLIYQILIFLSFLVLLLFAIKFWYQSFYFFIISFKALSFSLILSILYSFVRFKINVR